MGYTSKPLKERLSAHLRQKRRNHRTCWLKSLKKRNLSPTIKKLDSSNDYNEIIEKEIYWIRFFRKKGCSLVNATDGGEGLQGYRFSQEQKKMISERTKEAMKNLPQATKDRMRNSKKGKVPRNKRKVIDQNGTIYSSLTEAASTINVTSGAISFGIKNKKQTKAYSFRYYEEGVVRCEVYETKNSHRVKCNELNKEYVSIREAGRDLGLDPSSISNVCKGKSKTCGGFTFSYLK